MDNNRLVAYVNHVKVMPRKPPLAAIRLGFKLWLAGYVAAFVVWTIEWSLIKGMSAHYETIGYTTVHNVDSY